MDQFLILKVFIAIDKTDFALNDSPELFEIGKSMCKKFLVHSCIQKGQVGREVSKSGIKN